MTRALATLLLVACGGPQPTSGEPVRRSEWAVPAVVATATPDAAIDAAPELEPVPGVRTVSSETQAVLDAVKKSESEPDPEPAKEEPAEVNETTYEDGVAVVPATMPVWCVSGGRFDGVCELDKPHCARLSKSCRKQMNYACFRRTLRTSGEQELLCLVSYGKCDIFRQAAETNAENADVSDCIIFRAKKK